MNINASLTCIILRLFQLQLTAQMTVAPEIPENDLIPEGIAYDKTTGDLCTGSTWKRKILSIQPDGKVSEFAF